MFGLLLLAGVVWERTRDRDRVLHDAMTRTQQMAQLIGQHAARLFQANDLTLRRIADRVAARDWDEIQHSRELWNRMARSEEHTSELQSLMRISYAVFCLKNNIIRLSEFTKYAILITSHKYICQQS